MKTRAQSYPLYLCLLACLFFLDTLTVSAQQKSLAIIPADKNTLTRGLAETLNDSLEESFRIGDPDLVAPVVRSATAKNLFNLSLEEAKNIGTGIGCDFYIILRSENLRRSSFKKTTYYESYFVVFLVDARSGALIGWKQTSAEADDPTQADKNLGTIFKSYLREIPETLQKFAGAKQTPFDTSVYEISEGAESSLRTPLPFKRFSPASTPSAQYLRIEAVVDIEVAIDEKGYITATRIVRWAGFGLDEAVTDTVRKMNFRPATLGGKAIPARFLLRYNFRVPDAAKTVN